MCALVVACTAGTAVAQSSPRTTMASCHAVNRCESDAASVVPIFDPINVYGFIGFSLC